MSTQIINVDLMKKRNSYQKVNSYQENISCYVARAAAGAVGNDDQPAAVTFD